MRFRISLLIIGVMALFGLNIFFGSVHIDATDVLQTLLHGGESDDAISYIILGSRLPTALTAMLAGAGLATAGLLLQTSFHNPLAGPSILGISSGANLGVAIVMLAFGGTITAGLYSWSGYLAIVGAAFLGSMLIMGLLLLFSSLLKNNLMLLITGIMMGYITSSVISLLNFLASVENIQSPHLGHGQFQQCLYAADAHLRHPVHRGASAGFAAHQTPQCHSLRRELCRQSRGEHPAHA